MKFTKKLIVFVILLGLFTSCLAACKEESITQSTVKQDFEAYIASCCNSIAGADHSVELAIWKQDKYVDNTAKQTITKTINGEPVQGVYSHTKIDLPNNYGRHTYICENGNEMIIDDSGILQFYFWGKAAISAAKKETYTEEECLAIAKNFIRTDVLGDINFDQYTVKTDVDDDSGLYEFSFYKYIKGYKTTEEAHIYVHKSGALYAFGSYMFGKISEEDFVEFDSEKVAQVIDKKINAIYQNVKGNNSVMTYEEPEIHFTLLDNGEPALFCVVIVKFATPCGVGFLETSERLGLIIK